MRAEKIFGGAQINFRSNSGVKTKKKGFHPKTPSGYGPFASFRDTVLAREGICSLPGGARRTLMMRISVPAHKFRGKAPRKGSSARYLRLSFGVRLCFLS